MVLVGALLIIQGFGNVAARAIWGTDWGLLAMIPGVQSWTGAAVGTAGLLLVLAGLRAKRRKA